MRWLENHLNLINTYSVALENLDNYRGDYNYADYKYVDSDVCLVALLWIRFAWATKICFSAGTFTEIQEAGGRKDLKELLWRINRKV